MNRPTKTASNGHKDDIPIPPLSLARMQTIWQQQQRALQAEVDACSAALGIPADAAVNFDLDAGVIRFPEPKPVETPAV